MNKVVNVDKIAINLRWDRAYLKFALEKGGNRIGSPPFEGGFRGIELELEATPPTLKYAPQLCNTPGGIGRFQNRPLRLIFSFSEESKLQTLRPGFRPLKGFTHCGGTRRFTVETK